MYPRQSVSSTVDSSAFSFRGRIIDRPVLFLPEQVGEPFIIKHCFSAANIYFELEVLVVPLRLYVDSIITEYDFQYSTVLP